jgi:hypothetical protein
MRRETSSPPKGGGARSSDLVDAVWVENARWSLIAAIAGKGVSYVHTAFVERSPPTGMLK